METTVILHTANGDVNTTYPESWYSAMMYCVEQYIKEGKDFSIIHSK